MRRGTIRFLPGLIALLGCFSLAVAQVPAPNSFFDFEEGQGTATADLGIAGNHATLEGDAIGWASEGIVTKNGDTGHSVELTGDAFSGMGFVLVPYRDYLNSPNYTLSAWVRWTADANWGYLFWADGETWPEPVNTRHIDVWWNPSDVGLDNILHNADGMEFRTATKESECGINPFVYWHMVTVTLEENQVYSIYLDGELAVSNTSDIPIIDNTVNDLWVGARPNDAEMTNPVKMVGLIDRVRIWDGALNAEQVQALYNSEGPDGGTAVETGKPAGSVSRFGLSQNYPNPFNPATRIPFSLETREHARLTVYDSMGRPVRTLFDGVKAAGQYQAEWDGKNEYGASVPSGMYVCRLTAGQKTSIRKITYLQ